MEYAADDMFDNLPDEILGRVVAFLPGESGLETSLLSTRWRDLWNQTLIKYGSAEDITAAVAGFLAGFDEHDPLKHPRKLRFHSGQESTFSATIATNNKLLLDFSSGKKELEKQFELQLKFDQQQIVQQPIASSFVVKTLYLKSLSYLSGNIVSSLVSNLQHLESLILVEFGGLESLCIDSKSKLHKLTILDCLQLKSLHLRTSKLKSFQFRGRLPLILPENHFNLANAMFDFREGPSCTDLKVEDFDPILLTIKNSESLTLCEWTFKALICPSISTLCGNFIFYNLRELCWIVNNKDEQSSHALVSFLKLCPALEQLVVEIDPESYSAPRSDSCLKQATKYTALEHLKEIKFVGFANQEEEVSLARDLIQVVKGYPPRIVASDGSCLVTGQEFYYVSS